MRAQCIFFYIIIIFLDQGLRIEGVVVETSKRPQKGWFDWKSAVFFKDCPFKDSEWSDFPEMHLIEILRLPFVVVESSKRAHSIEKLKGLELYLIVESDWRATKPLPTFTNSLSTPNQNFETAILFNVVEKSRNYVFEDDNSPQPSKQGL